MQNAEGDNWGFKSLEKELIQPEILAILFSHWERLKKKDNQETKNAFYKNIKKENGKLKGFLVVCFCLRKIKVFGRKIESRRFFFGRFCRFELVFFGLVHHCQHRFFQVIELGGHCVHSTHHLFLVIIEVSKMMVPGRTYWWICFACRSASAGRRPSCRGCFSDH